MPLSVPVANAARARGLAKLVPWVLGAAVAVAVVAALYWQRERWLPLVGMGEKPAEPAGPEQDPEPPRVVTLPPEKLKSAGIELGKVEERELAGARTVPGKLDYNTARRLELTSPAAAVVQEVLVGPGEKLKAGAKLAVLTSSEIGLARDEVLAHEADLAIARKEADVQEEVAGNIGHLLEALEERPTLPQVEDKFSGKRLGTYRETVLGAYSKLRLAESIVSSTASLDSPGAISGRVREERQSAREVASAAFHAACEEASVHAVQDRDRAAAAAAHAERLLKISQRHLAALLGPFADPAPVSDAERISEFALCAPFAATVEERSVAKAERVTAGQALFTLADTSTLWIAAEIHERDWQLASIRPGASLEVTSPALPGKTFTATVHHIGAKVSPETRSMPLVAEIDNQEGLFRPGMFVWVTISHDATVRRLVVPTSAIVRQDGAPLVFVPDGERSFRRIDVETGLETPEWIEIKSGLSLGQPVVTQGGFFLKSELLLEREE